VNDSIETEKDRQGQGFVDRQSVVVVVTEWSV